MADLTQSQWKENFEEDDNAVLIDVRTESEMEEGHIPHALHMDIYNSSQFISDAKDLDPTKNYYIYCRSGGRSAQACAIFNSLGIKNTYNLLGGFSKWEGEKV